jgi:hypothetical protein
MPDGERKPGCRGAGRRDQLRAPAAADLPCDERRDHGDRCGRERRRKPEQERRARVERVHRVAEQRHERRLVRVAESRVRPRHDEVQLVSVEPVPGACREQRRNLKTGDQEHRRRQASAPPRIVADVLGYRH